MLKLLDANKLSSFTSLCALEALSILLLDLCSFGFDLIDLIDYQVDSLREHEVHDLQAASAPRCQVLPHLCLHERCSFCPDAFFVLCISVHVSTV